MRRRVHGAPAAAQRAAVCHAQPHRVHRAGRRGGAAGGGGGGRRALPAPACHRHHHVQPAALDPLLLLWPHQRRLQSHGDHGPRRRRGRRWRWRRRRQRRQQWCRWRRWKRRWWWWCGGRCAFLPCGGGSWQQLRGGIHCDGHGAGQPAAPAHLRQPAVYRVEPRRYPPDRRARVPHPGCHGARHGRRV